MSIESFDVGIISATIVIVMAAIDKTELTVFFVFAMTTILSIFLCPLVSIVISGLSYMLRCLRSDSRQSEELSTIRQPSSEQIQPEGLFKAILGFNIGDKNTYPLIYLLKGYFEEISKDGGKKDFLTQEQCTVLAYIVNGELLLSKKLKKIHSRNNNFFDSIIQNGVKCSGEKFHNEISGKGLKYLINILSAHYAQLNVEAMPDKDLKYLNSNLPKNGGYVVMEVNDNLEDYHKIINELKERSKGPVNTEITVDITQTMTINHNRG